MLPGFGRIIDINTHYLSDDSEYRYGQRSCIRYVNKDGLIHCSLLLWKSRHSPKKFISIPRLDLTAVVLSVKITYLLRKELQIDGLKGKFGANNQEALAYPMSQAKKVLIMMLHKGLILQKKNLIVIGFMADHSYGKLRHLGQIETAA